MAEIQNLTNAWEWNFITGDPYIPRDTSPNSRYCPTPAEMDDVIRRRNVTEQEVKERLFTFFTSNDQEWTTNWDAKNNSRLLGFMRLLRALDFKKIEVTYWMGALRIIKLPRNTQFRGEPYDGLVSNMRHGRATSVHRMVADINHNALLGWRGPGTFPCGHPLCTLCEHVGRSSTVDLGQHGLLHITKRASCTTRNAVYVGVCTQCAAENTFSCYFGESSEPLHARCKAHASKPCSTRSGLTDIQRFPTVESQRTEVARVLAEGSDPENILRDWFAHVTTGGIHPGSQRMSVVGIYPHAFLRKTWERFMVATHMFHHGDFHYLPMGRGCLNTYSHY